MADLDALLVELPRWAADHAVPVETVAYGDHPDQIVEWRGEGPTVAVLHGGFWRPVWDRSTTVPLAIALARNGWRTANVEYRRRPGRWRELLDDIAAAAALVQPQVAVGHSAGGHLALWLADVPAVALAGVCDVELAARRWLGDGAVIDFLGGSVRAHQHSIAAGFIRGLNHQLVDIRQDVAPLGIIPADIGWHVRNDRIFA